MKLAPPEKKSQTLDLVIADSGINWILIADSGISWKGSCCTSDFVETSSTHSDEIFELFDNCYKKQNFQVKKMSGKFN